MTLFRVVVNPTYADLQWFRFLVKKRQKVPTFIFRHRLNPVFMRTFLSINLPVIGRHGYLDKNVQKIPWFYF